jgi:hypothetical protein
MPHEMTYSEALAHFGIKGMHWGTHKAQPGSPKISSTRPTSKKPRFTGTKPPSRPREATSDAVRADQIVAKALNRGYDRSVGVAMATHIRDVPSHSHSSDPGVNALLSRVLTQSVNRVEEQAGRQFMANLPTGR